MVPLQPLRDGYTCQLPGGAEFLNRLTRDLTGEPGALDNDSSVSAGWRTWLTVRRRFLYRIKPSSAGLLTPLVRAERRSTPPSRRIPGVGVHAARCSAIDQQSHPSRLLLRSTSDDGSCPHTAVRNNRRARLSWREAVNRFLRHWSTEAVMSRHSGSSQTPI
jgi:hypothetical protein